MDKEQIVKLFDELLDARSASKDAAARLDAFKAEAKEPVLPKIFQSLDDYQDFERNVNRYRRQLAEHEVISKEAKAVLEEIERKLIGLLPRLVWFHYREYAIGVAYSNWGGSTFYVEVEPYSENPSSLDRTYRGD